MVDERINSLEINLQDLLMFYLRKWWIIALCFAVGLAVALGVTLRLVTPMYRAKVSIYVNNNRVFDENKEYLSGADLTAAQRLVNTYVSIANSNRVLEEVAAALGGDYTAEKLSGMISAAQLNQTEIFNIFVSHSDPKEAARIANVAAEVAPEVISNLIDGTSARVIDTAKEPKSPYSPNYTNYAAIGGAAGALLAIVVLTIFFLQDTRIKDENDLTDMFELPILGRIPDFEYSPSQNSYGYSSDEDSEEAEKRKEVKI